MKVAEVMDFHGSNATTLGYTSAHNVHVTLDLQAAAPGADKSRVKFEIIDEWELSVVEAGKEVGS